MWKRQQQQQQQSPFQQLDWQQWVQQQPDNKKRSSSKPIVQVPPLSLPPLVPISKKTAYVPQKQSSPRLAFKYRIPQQERPSQMLIAQQPLASGRKNSSVRLPPLSQRKKTPRTQN